jgi:UDP-N-acetylmuramoyl-L-alanyl-D-glutamate--2,6-diaminopimelate ligase
MWLLDGIASIPATDARVHDLTLDSRAARPGSLFLALAGQKSHGLEFAQDAVARGATMILWEPDGKTQPPKFSSNIYVAVVPELRSLMGRIADRYFGWPSQHLRITAVTGTNGKTTSAYLIAQCLQKLGLSSAYIGTIGYGKPDALREPSHTTPDVISVHRILAEMRAAGVRDVAMEVSSHALDQERVSGVRFHTAAFTNLTRDHLDYHKTMQAYGAAKAKLLNMSDLKHLVIHIGDAFGREFTQSYLGRVPLTAVWIGGSDSAWLAERGLCATEVKAERRGISMKLEGTYGKAQASAALVGRFNSENSLVVMASLLSLGFDLAEAVRALAACHAAPGRMELIEAPQSGKPTAVVDYAHTPDALAKALDASREHCEGKLWCVFGCGGDRDPGKRPLMGSIADERADQVIVTDDNPRSEDPAAITSAIAAGITSKPYRVIHSRRDAIATAIREANVKDLVLIAGKGHEDYQIYGNERLNFSDRLEAQRSLGVAA